MVLVRSTATDQLLLLSCSTLFSVVLPAEALPQCGSPEHRLVLPRWGAGPPASASGATFYADMSVHLGSGTVYSPERLLVV